MSNESLPEGMQQDGAPDVEPVGRQAAIVVGVELLGEGALIACDGGDIGPDRGDELALAEARHDLLADGLADGVQVVQMDGVRIRRRRSRIR